MDQFQRDFLLSIVARSRSCPTGRLYRYILLWFQFIYTLLTQDNLQGYGCGSSQDFWREAMGRNRGRKCPTRLCDNSWSEGCFHWQLHACLTSQRICWVENIRFIDCDFSRYAFYYTSSWLSNYFIDTSVRISSAISESLFSQRICIWWKGWMDQENGMESLGLVLLNDCQLLSPLDFS